MNRALTLAMIAAVCTLGIASAAQASDGSFNEMNLPWGTEVAPSDHVFTPGPEAVFTFPSALSTIVGSGDFIDGEQVGFFWSVERGDSVTEIFSGPNSATSYSLDVDVITNSLVVTRLNWNVFLNGVLVDNFSVAPGFVGTVSRTAMFPSIPGPNYTVELRVTNEVEGGGGSHTFRYAGVGLNQIDIRGSDGIVICLDSFCDTFDCGLDNDGIHTCMWNYNCTGTDNEPMIGAKVGRILTLGGDVDSQETTWGWRIDAPGRTMSLYRHNGVGDSTLFATDTFSLNSCDFVRSGESVLDSIQ